MADLSFEVETRVYRDLDAKLASGDWSFDQGEAEAYGELAGRAGGAAACSALGLAPAAPLCAQIGGSIAGWIVGQVWGVFSGLFGSDHAANRQKADEWRAWYDAQIRGIREAHEASEDATRAVLDRLAELGAVTIGSAMKQGDWIALLASEGAQLISCSQEITDYTQEWAQPKKWVMFQPRLDQWPCNVPGSGYSLPVQGAGWWLVLLGRQIPRSYDRAWIEPAFAAQRAYLDSLRIASVKAAARLIAIGAGARAAQEAGIASRPMTTFFEAGPDYEAPAPGWGAIALVGAGALGLVLLANR